MTSIEQVFDTGLMVALAERLDPDLLRKIKPVTLSKDRLLEVPEVLRPLMPWGGIQRGTTVAFAGVGGWSLAMAVMAEALGSEGWLAVVGVPSFNLSAASEFGVRLDRVLVVQDPGPGRWGTVVATLLESVDMVAVAPGLRVGDRDRRRLTARAREQESVLVHLDGGRTWPSTTDVTFEVHASSWEGIGVGHGHLTKRRAVVGVKGRRTGAASATVPVWLPDENGQLSAAPELAPVLSLSS